MDWIEKSNKGITHFGLDPHFLPLSSIRFDVFHLWSSITRHLLSRLRAFIFSQEFECKEALENILATEFNGYFILVWNTNCPLSSLRGKQILGFIMLIPKVVGFIEGKFMMTTYLRHLCAGFTLWKEISGFIHQMEIVDEKDYEKQIILFNSNVKLFYKHGSKSFLTKAETGDSETFYMHALRFYLPVIVDDTWRQFHVGIGIYTMQGFERCNKEAKNVFTRHTNKKGNVLIQCMYWLWNHFSYDDSNHIAE